jgi:hypothetical protein
VAGGFKEQTSDAQESDPEQPAAGYEKVRFAFP